MLEANARSLRIALIREILLPKKVLLYGSAGKIPYVTPCLSNVSTYPLNIPAFKRKITRSERFVEGAYQATA